MMQREEKQGLPGGAGAETTGKQGLESIKETMLAVIKSPAAFFAKMPAEGGLADPFIFLVAMAVLTGIIQAALSLIGLGPAAGLLGGLVYIILSPVMAAIFGFVGAAILFVIWRLMGSDRSYETAYRCGAYIAAITPLTTVINVVPFLGSIVSILWTTFLLITASVAVHRLREKTARIVFGVIAALFILFSIGAQIAARKASRLVEDWQVQVDEQTGEMSPEEAGKMMGQFLKGMQEEMAGEKAKSENPNPKP